MRVLLGRTARGIAKIPALGRLMRWYARWSSRRKYPDGTLVTIKMGHLAGKKWPVYHDGSPIWLGLYEMWVQDAIARKLRPGMVFYDIGANHGFFSLLASRCVGAQGRVFSFEPVVANVERLKLLLEANQVENTMIVQSVVSDITGEGLFYPGASSLGHGSILRDKYNVRSDLGSPVPSTTLDDFIRGQPVPDLLKVDVEGAEVEVLEGSRELLSTRRASFLVELHGQEQNKRAREILQESGYEFRTTGGKAVYSEQLPQWFLAVPG